MGIHQSALGSDGSPGKFTLRKTDNSLCEVFVDVGKVEVSATDADGESHNWVLDLGH